MATATTPRPVHGRIGDHGTWRIVPTRSGRFFCYADDCLVHARWKGLVGPEDFNAGRACDEHWPNLLRIVRNLADGWQPPPSRY